MLSETVKYRAIIQNRWSGVLIFCCFTWPEIRLRIDIESALWRLYEKNNAWMMMITGVSERKTNEIDRFVTPAFCAPTVLSSAYTRTQAHSTGSIHRPSRNGGRV